MFSFFGHKKEKKHSPGEQEDTSQPPIPGPAEDFVVVNRRTDLPYPTMNPSMGGPGPIYPSFGQPSNATMVATAQKKEDNFLQGVPFNLNKDFSADSRNDILSIQLSEIMAYCTRRLQVETTDYEFSVEKGVLRES
ncbi:uncharacterized protein LOC143919622 [Arctopsyche grandis]|uniref:uncharacterized protein LOC143919622 n=1 Tax=Arctopsyche grandis TaxID=121162 RepID=UPI00406D9371